MKPAGLLRLYRDHIRHVGIARFEQSEETMYAAADVKLLLRQRRAMELLQHLDVAPKSAQIYRMRGLYVMKVTHPQLTHFMTVWQGETRPARIELIRRLGATVGMVHSLRHSGTGDVIQPHPKPVSQHLVEVIRANYRLLSLRGRSNAFPQACADLVAEAKELWGSAGGTLAGNWVGFPPVKIWDSGLMIMDLAQARYSVPLMDLVNIRPQTIGLGDLEFFWEYFLQGYGATCELPSQGREKIDLLYRIRLLQAMATERGERAAQEDWESRWWEKYN